MSAMTFGALTAVDEAITLCRVLARDNPEGFNPRAR